MAVFLLFAASLCPPATASHQLESPRAVTFQLTPYAPVIPSIKNLSFLLYPVWDRKGTLVIHTAEWEIRDAEHHLRVARIPVIQNFREGIRDERPSHSEGSRNDFDQDQLRRIGSVGAGDYRLALLINGVRASNVIAFKIDPSFDILKAPVLYLGIDEAPPGVDMGALLVWIVGPTPPDPQFTNFAMAFADIFVDGKALKKDPRPWSGPVGPYQSGKPNVTVYDSTFDLKGVDLNKPHNFRIQVGKYISNMAHLDLSSQALAHEWDEMTANLIIPATPKPLLVGTVRNEHGDPASGWEIRIGHEGSCLYTEHTDENGQYTFCNIKPGAKDINFVVRHK